MIRFVILVSIAILGAVGSPLSNTCLQLIANNGLSKNFNETIAHAIHSMTVEGLKMFNSKATESNNIPTVNHNLKSRQNVLPFAPHDPVGSDFATHTMNTIDKILSHLGNSDDGLGPNWSPIERVAHTFHMLDLWVKIHELYWQKVAPNPPSSQLCACLTRTEDNGIKAAVKWVADHYESGTPITLLNRPIPKLTDASSWAVWKERLLHYYGDNALFDAATYLSCATRDF